MSKRALPKTATSDSELLFQAVINHMGDGLLAIDERGIVQLFNPACEKMFGYSPKEILGENISLLIPRLNHAQREFDAVHKNGTVFPTEITITEIPLQGKLLYAATIRDASQRKTAEANRHGIEEQLRISKERLELGWRGAGDGMWDWDVNSNTVTLSDRMKEFLGYAPRELSDHFDEWASRLHPDDKEATFGILEEHLRGKAPYDVEYRLLTKSGEWRWFRARGQAIWDKAGQPVRMAGSLTDITDRKVAETIRERLIKQLTDANEQLEQFAYIASHDLREPLRIVVSFTDLLLREYGESIGSEGREYMSISRKAAKKMEAMVADLLEYGRLSHEAERFSEIDCNKKLEMAREALGEAIRSTGAIIESGPLPKVIGNPLRFSRLLQNLIGNALKYQHPGGKPRIRVWAEDKGNHWQFAVADNGIGIRPEYLESIFAPFKRLHSDQEYVGTGIGLAICRKIVEGLGGTIWVESTYGSGTSFFFTVPKRNKTIDI